MSEQIQAGQYQGNRQVRERMTLAFMKQFAAYGMLAVINKYYHGQESERC